MNSHMVSQEKAKSRSRSLQDITLLLCPMINSCLRSTFSLIQTRLQFLNNI